MTAPEHVDARSCPPWCARSDGHGPAQYLAWHGCLGAALVVHEAPVLARSGGVPVLLRSVGAVWSDGMVVLDDEAARVVVELDPSRDFTAAEARELAAALLAGAEMLERAA